MSKYFKNYKSEGDGERRSVGRSTVHPRSYSCKPDIGPSGDHKYSETSATGTKPSFRLNMWMNNAGSGSSESSYSNNELYKLNEDHLDKINFIRRKLHLMELQDIQQTGDATEETCKINANNEEAANQKQSGTNKLICSANNNCNQPKTFPHNLLFLSSINESSKVSILTNDSTVRYKPPLKKICQHAQAQSATAVLPPINTNKTNCLRSDVIEIPRLNLDNEQTSQHNENKSIQCTSKDTEVTESSSHSTESVLKCQHRGERVDNIDLVEVDLHVESEIMSNQSAKTVKTPNKNCIKFLPIKDEELTCPEKHRPTDFFDEIVSNCTFSFGKHPTPLAPSHDSFFKSRKKQRKKRFKKKGRAIVEDVNLDKPSIEVQRTFLNTSDTSDAIQEINDNGEPVSGIVRKTNSYDNTLTTGLTIPSKIVKPLKLPLVTKLSEFIHGKNFKNIRNAEMEEFQFEDDISSEKSSSRKSRKTAGQSREFSNYKEVAEDLLSSSDRITEDMKYKEMARHRTKSSSSNKYNTKQKQSVDYNYYSMGLPAGITCEDMQVGREVEENSDSDCYGAVQNCCCIRAIFKRRRPSFSSN